MARVAVKSLKSPSLAKARARKMGKVVVASAGARAEVLTEKALSRMNRFGYTTTLVQCRLRK